MKALEFGLVGSKLGHSFSASFFSTKFDRENLPYSYRNFELADIEELPLLLAAHPFLRGFNVTIPYKERIISYLSSLTEEAEKAGAVNTVFVSPTGLRGHNTDITGFGKALTGFLGDVKPQQALILGSGGAAKAVAVALSQKGIEATVVSRDSRKGISYPQLTAEVLAGVKLIVNATPLGMWPDIESRPEIPYEALNSSHYCFDLVYNPLVTAFMKSASACGAKVCNGLQMLHLQAEAAWDWWQTSMREYDLL